MDGWTARQLDCIRRNLDGIVLFFHAPFKVTLPQSIKDTLLPRWSQIFCGHFCEAPV